MVVAAGQAFEGADEPIKLLTGQDIPVSIVVHRPHPHQQAVLMAEDITEKLNERQLGSVSPY